MANIRVEGPDGHIFEFPEGTPEHVRKTTIQRHYGTSDAQKNTLANASSAMVSPPKRTAGERFGDVFVDGWQRGFVASGWRAGYDDAADALERLERGEVERTPFTLNPIRPIAGIVAMTQNGTGLWGSTERAREIADEMSSEERERRDKFKKQSDADPFYKVEGIGGKTIHGVAALGGVLTSAALDPTSYISGGSSVWAKMGIQGLVAGGIDISAQLDDASSGVQDRMNYVQTVLSAAAGAGIQGITHAAGTGFKRAFKKGEETIDPTLGDQLLRDELDHSDKINLPAMTTDDMAKPKLVVDIPKAEAPKAEIVPIEQPKAKPDAEAEAGPKTEAEAEAPKAEVEPEDPWNGVDWGLAGSPERAKAAMAHLDKLKQYVKPEQVDNFVSWLGRQGDQIVGTSDANKHWNMEWIDFDKMAATPEQFEGLTNTMADIFKPLYDAAGDATKTWAETQNRLSTFGVNLSDAIKGHADITGEYGVAQKIHALEAIALQHNEVLVQKLNAMQKARMTGTMNAEMVTDLAQHVQLTKMFDAMAAGAKSEIARALNIMKASKDRVKVTNDLQDALDELAKATNANFPDEGKLGEVLETLIVANKNGGAAGTKNALRQMDKMTAGDYIAYNLTMGYLSTFSTFFANVVGGLISTSLSVSERYIAAAVTSPLRRLSKNASADYVSFREANAYVTGIANSFVEAAVMSGRAFKTAQPQTDGLTSFAGDSAFKVPLAINSQRINRWKQRPVTSLPEIMAAGYTSALRTLGHRPTLAMDEFNKVMTARMQLNALAVREAQYKAARHTGAEREKVFKKTLEAVSNRPSSAAVAEAKAIFANSNENYIRSGEFDDAMLQKAADVLDSVDLHAMAADHARLLTFQNAGPRLKEWEKALGQSRFLKALYVPFFRTPVLLVKMGMVDHNPALAFLTKENRDHLANYTAAARGIDQTLERGGAEADLMMARMVTGIGIMTFAGFMHTSGNIVGKRTPAEEQDGVKSYSIRIGGRWYQYSRLSPIAEPLGLVADMMQAFKDYDVNDPEELQSIGGAVLMAITNNIVNKAALTGIGDLFDLIDPAFSATEESRGAQAGKAIGKKTADSAIPAIVRNSAWTADPVMREANTFIEMVMANLPKLSESLPEKRDWLGRPIIRKDKDNGFIEGVVSPIRVSDETSHLVRREVSALAQMLPSVRLAQTPPSRFNNEKITSKERSLLLEYQGQIYRDPMSGMNMEEHLFNLIQSQEYADAPDVQRAEMIREAVTKYRRRANDTIKRGNSGIEELDAMAHRTALGKTEEDGDKKGWDEFERDRRARRAGANPSLFETQ